MDPFVAEIRIFPFNFAPRGWAFCAGQLLPISQNTALFSLLGTTYGGDGRSNFALPDLQGNVPLHPGQGPGLSLYDLGETGGSDTVTLLQTEIPSHPHNFNAQAEDADRSNASGNSLGGPGDNIYVAGTGNSTGNIATTLTGGGQPHNNLQPYLTLNFCIALQGVFPPRT